MKALVTGVAGFVGAHLATRLVSGGWDVVGTVRPGTTADRLDALGMAGAVHLLPVDLSDREAVDMAVAVADPDVAFLLAASRGEATPHERAATVAVNTTSVGWLIDGLPDRCHTVVGLGSSTEYGEAEGPMDESSPLRPRGFFGATKAAGSLLLAATCARHPARRAAVLRAFQVYGPLDHPGRLVPTALRAARAGSTMALTGPGQKRDWVFVDDVTEACVRAALSDQLPAGQVLNIGTGRQVANEELVATVEKVTGMPVAVAVGAHPPRQWDTASWVCDPSLARQLLGWEAKVGLDEGLRRCWETSPA